MEDNSLIETEEHQQDFGNEEEELNRCEIDGVFCPICCEAWTSGGEHQMCCLPCGHIYGLSCIKKRLQQCPSPQKVCHKENKSTILTSHSYQCPQCNSLCTLKDVRVLYATRLCVADEMLLKRVRSLKAKCANLERMVHIQPLIREKQTADCDTLIQQLEIISVKQQEIIERHQKDLVDFQKSEERLQQLLYKMRGHYQEDLEHQAFLKSQLDDRYIKMCARSYGNYYPYGLDDTGSRSRVTPQPPPQPTSEVVDAI